MRGAFNKDVLRSVTHSLGRFLAIAGIVALGTGFYAGLRMTAPDMKLAADHFYDQLLRVDGGQIPCPDISPVLEHRNPVADAIDFFHSVGNVYHRNAPLAQAANNLKQRMDLLLIQHGCRLVKHDYSGVF